MHYYGKMAVLICNKDMVNNTISFLCLFHFPYIHRNRQSKKVVAINFLSQPYGNGFEYFYIIFRLYNQTSR